MPLHKLSQWLAYSLIEPLERAGIAVTDVDGLTGLAEYRNGGLFIDTGVLALRDPEPRRVRRIRVDSTARGRMARADGRAARPAGAAVCGSASGAMLRRLPLAKILQGGTWAAGRAIARRLRRRRLAAAAGDQRRHGVLREAERDGEA